MCTILNVKKILHFSCKITMYMHVCPGADPGGGGGGSWGSGLPPSLWGTPKLHKEGKNVVCVCPTRTPPPLLKSCIRPWAMPIPYCPFKFIPLIKLYIVSIIHNYNYNITHQVWKNKSLYVKTLIKHNYLRKKSTQTQTKAR